MFDFFEIFQLSDEWVSSWLRCQFLIFLLTATVDKQYTDSVKCWVTFTIRLTYIHFIFSLLKVDVDMFLLRLLIVHSQNIFSVIRRFSRIFFMQLLWVLWDGLCDGFWCVLLTPLCNTIKLSQSWDKLTLVKIRMSIIRMWSFTLLFLPTCIRLLVGYFFVAVSTLGMMMWYNKKCFRDQTFSETTSRN